MALGMVFNLLPPPGISQRSRPSPSAPPWWVHGPQSASWDFPQEEAGTAQYWILLCPPSSLPAESLGRGNANWSPGSEPIPSSSLWWLLSTPDVLGRASLQQ